MTVILFYRPYKIDLALTSNHSVAPTAPYSPALQLANTRLLLGLNPSEEETNDEEQTMTDPMLTWVTTTGHTERPSASYI